MSGGKLPEHISRIESGDMFSFLCHKGISCFTNCCRELELALTPYDVLRLRHATGLTSAELHERYIIEEQTGDDIFPRFYLTMVDDGQASCAFVNDKGCSIYQNRPGACRTYPLGRGTVRGNGGMTEQFVVLQEPHCQGFREKTVQTVQGFMKSQELEVYNRFNDLLTAVTQHQKIKQGMQLTASQVILYRLALYDLDSFRTRLTEESDGRIDSPLAIPEAIEENDEALLEFAFKFIGLSFFGS